MSRPVKVQDHQPLIASHVLIAAGFMLAGYAGAKGQTLLMLLAIAGGVYVSYSVFMDHATTSVTLRRVASEYKSPEEWRKLQARERHEEVLAELQANRERRARDATERDE